MNIQTKFERKTISYDELLEKFKQLLRLNGLKYTIQREIILEVLYNCEEHLSPEALQSLIQKKYPEVKIGIATIYRTLSLLEDSEIVTSLSFDATGKKYEVGTKDHHDHLICTECGDIFEFVDNEIEKRQKEIAKHLNFTITDHTMHIYGICESCSLKKK